MWLVLWSVLLAIVSVVGWLLNLFGLPGNWVNVAAVVLYAWLMPPDMRISIGWPVVIALAVLAGIGELVEFAAGAIGVGQVGGTKRGAALAIVGSIIGGVVGAFIGIPIPLIGSMIAVLLGAGLGATAGAMLGEHWAGKSLEHTLHVGQAAFWGRVFGTLGKLIIGSMIVALTFFALVIDGTK